jgi:peptide/nickel transport system permease protein
MILLFSIHLDWLPFVYRTDLDVTGWRWYWEMFRQSIMPILVLGLFQAPPGRATSAPPCWR